MTWPYHHPSETALHQAFCLRTVYARLLRIPVRILHRTDCICSNQAPAAENNPEDPAQPNRFNAVIEKIERLYMVTNGLALVESIFAIH
jgi:hypothetical protein